MKPFFTDKSPFENPPKIPEKIEWVKPAFVCEVAFAEWTLDGELRPRTFLGWRDDEDPEDVVLEQREKANIRKWRSTIPNPATFNSIVISAKYSQAATDWNQGCETMRRRRKLLPPPETPSDRISQVCRRQINFL